MLLSVLHKYSVTEKSRPSFVKLIFPLQNEGQNQNTKRIKPLVMWELKIFENDRDK
jgi:hypothetical protein